MKTLNIIGPGRVGRTLGALWAQSNAFLIGDVYARTATSGRTALAFIGAGRSVKSVADMAPADVWLVATPDAHIVAACAAVAEAGRFRPGDIVFHCSGAMAASDLRRATAAVGVRVASVHPLKTFANAADAKSTFEGTFCVAEGDEPALDVLRAAFDRIGARLIAIDAVAKPLYHAASALVCNDLTALMEAGLRCYAHAGIDRELAVRMMEPLVRETIDNVFKRGTVAALTGPVVRGDVATVEKHVRGLDAVDPRIGSVYRDLSSIALELARERLDAEAVLKLAEILSAARAR
ncbi:MAG: Rossmann-like and DUF2520 domain-containing protein [Rhodospirillaceae bacterium]